MSSNYERSEKRIAHSLQNHHDMHGVMHELHNMQNHESHAAFKKDLGRLNHDLHQQGLLPGLHITENGRTHKIGIKPDGNAPASDTQPAHRRSGHPQEATGDTDAHHAGHGGQRHHDGHHKGHHGGRSKDGSQDQDPQAPSDSTSGRPTDSRRGSPDSDRSGPAKDIPDGAKDSQDLTKADKEKYLMERLTDPKGLNLTKAQAAGVIGNLEHESHLSQKYSSHKNGDGRTEHNLGIAQWVGARKHAMEKFAGGDAQNFYKQVAFMEHELQGSEKGALNALRKTKDASHAALAFSRRYERPGDPHNGSRVHYAQLAYARLAGQENT